MMNIIRRNAQFHMNFACLFWLDAGRTWQKSRSNGADHGAYFNRLLEAKCLIQSSFELIQSLTSLELL